ncbi:OX-2 membrane glycoprotein-like [Siniperca chuatsi]|uniref:OX-2 membrane glycoprotein-like n=1 Tax=Siniperca chuatsi TaxID=119488 RepID=UPI001CE1B02F|nr:OX-2 membrane glycoprotein-like [Siniperca chuatsi]
MANGAVLYLLVVLGSFQKGLPAVIETQRTVMAAVGEEARFSCQLLQSKDVLQVTWQKLLSEGQKTLATDNKIFGHKVNPDFRDQVEFKGAGLQNSSIVIRKVTEQDEGCYRCLFNTYPEGALTGTTCLQLYELHEALLHVRESNSPEEAVVSCSATGRPAPTVTLSVLRHNVHFSNRSSVRVTNTNGTVTVTATAVLPRFHGNSTQVGCAVRVRSGPQREVFMMIPEVKQSFAAGFDEESGPEDSDFNFTLIIVVSVLVSCVCVAAVIAIMLKQKHQNGHSEIKTPLKPTEPNYENKTPLLQIKQVNEHPRQRSTAKKKESDNPRASSSTAKCQRQLFSQKSPV